MVALLFMVALQTPQAGAPCPRPVPRTTKAGEEIVVADVRTPCRFSFRDAPIRLTSDPNGARPDAGREVERDSRGRFYSANAQGFPATISLWDANGRYVKSFGRPGEGPGELSASGLLSLAIDGRDNLHVRDGAPAWTVFSRDQQLVRRAGGQHTGPLDATVFLDNGNAVSVARAGDDYFVLVDSTGARVRSFGRIEAAARAANMRPDRRLAYAGGGSFWASPSEDGSPSGYLLEEWSVDGTPLKSIRRTPKWYPAEVQGRGMPAAAVDALHVDASGLIYVVLFVPDRRLREMSPSERSAITESQRDDLLTLYIEVIDGRSGALLVSEQYKYSQLVNSNIPRRMFRGTLSGFRVTEDAAGLPVVQIVDTDLVAK